MVLGRLRLGICYRGAQLQLGFLKVPGSGFRRDAGALCLVYEPDLPLDPAHAGPLSDLCC